MMNEFPKILVAFNRYRQRGGEDGVFEAETALLEQYGHRVIRFVAEPWRDAQWLAKVWDVVWSQTWYERLTDLVRREKPDIVHVHNWFPSLSPAVLAAAHAQGVPVVQTLHNYRLYCPAAIAYRDGKPCDDCLGRRVAWPGIWHACYRRSRAQTAGVAAILAFHRLRRTWYSDVDAYICLTEFARQKFLAAGLPADRLLVKPNFVARVPSGGPTVRQGALFVGRLSPEKGIECLLQAWRSVGARLPLRIVGDGPLVELVRRAEREIPGVEYWGAQPPARVRDLMQAAAVLVFPSQWYEGFPLTIAEALACGLPVLAARCGAAASLITHERTGRHFAPHDAADLVTQAHWLCDHPQEWAGYQREALAEYERYYVPERNYELLLQVYRAARHHHRAAP